MQEHQKIQRPTAIRTLSLVVFMVGSLVAFTGLLGLFLFRGRLFRCRFFRRHFALGGSFFRSGFGFAFGLVLLVDLRCFLLYGFLTGLADLT